MQDKIAEAHGEKFPVYSPRGERTYAPGKLSVPGGLPGLKPFFIVTNETWVPRLAEIITHMRIIR